MEHTPGKWTLVIHTNKFEIPEIGLSWSRSHSTSMINDANIKNSEVGQEELANAQFIVKAVNCHDELMEALKALVQNFKNGLDNGAISPRAYMQITAKAFSAIAKAEAGVK